MNTKSINPVQKYLYIIESFTCILKMFVLILLLLINLLKFSGMCSPPKLSKYVTLATQYVPIDMYSSRFTT